MLIFLSCTVGFFLAYTNGGNDNFKGVATLYGSGVTDYKSALIWSTVTTLLGSLTALYFAHGLIASFSGRGLVPDDVVAMKSFALAVGLSAAITVMLATKLGFPISTTHALSGGLVGAGLLASDAGVNIGKLFLGFFLPLLISPLAAFLTAIAFYFIFQLVRKKLQVQKETCICVGNEVVSVVAGNRAFAIETLSIKMDINTKCIERYQGNLLGIGVGRVIDTLHLISAGTVCFARALNDTPKLASVLLIGGAFGAEWAIVGVCAGMILGGLIHSRKIAETMGHKVTTMSGGQGFSANLVTGLIVILASKFNLPVSTTHVSCGSIFGIGLLTKEANTKTIVGILLSWVTTLPVAGILSAGIFLLLKNILTI